MLELFLLTLGLIGLWLGTELVIKGAVKIATYYNLSEIFIGIAVLAIGTDLPEMVISLNASIQNVVHDVNTSGIIIGNAIGSSFTQISLVLGLAGLLGYLTLSKRHLYEDGIVLLGAVLFLILLGFDGLITRIEGIVLIVIYLIYYSKLIHQERFGQKIRKKLDKGVGKDFLLLILGMVIVIFASEIVVDNAVRFSERL
ncbi:MAG: hypothetical protein HKN52_01405, partial [Eudoraea sp.]|nr:hypothetical protein [Eudoraea sp.]